MSPQTAYACASLMPVGPHPFVVDTVRRFADIADMTTIVLTHINHSNAINDPTSTIATTAAGAGFSIASDGMIFDRDSGDD